MENQQEEKQIILSKTKDYIKEYNKKRYQKDRLKLLEKMKEKYRCECCKVDVLKYYKNKHELTKKHQALL